MTYTALRRRSSVVATDATVRVLTAILAGHYLHGDIARATGLLSRSSVAHHLRILRRHGLVDWDEEHRGTIRACVRIVPLSVLDGSP